MSLRQYRPRGNVRLGLSPIRKRIMWGTFLLSILLQMIYPLVHGGLLRAITIATVYATALAMVAHAHFAYGARYSISYVAITGLFAFSVEVIGVKTGWPFGNYQYDSSLGYAIAGVPIVVPCAWMMLAHPLLIAARRVAHGWVFLYGGAGLMAWDLFLDPQMVSAHRWIWESATPSVPFEPMIPLSNAAGWLFAGMGLMALLHLALPKERKKSGAKNTVADLALIWTLFGGVIGNIFFFDRPGTALIGGVVFGAIITPYFFSLRFGRPDYL